MLNQLSNCWNITAFFYCAVSHWVIYCSLRTLTMFSCFSPAFCKVSESCRLELEDFPSQLPSRCWDKERTGEFVRSAVLCLSVILAGLHKLQRFLLLSLCNSSCYGQPTRCLKSSQISNDSFTRPYIQCEHTWIATDTQLDCWTWLKKRYSTFCSNHSRFEDGYSSLENMNKNCAVIVLQNIYMLFMWRSTIQCSEIKNPGIYFLIIQVISLNSWSTWFELLRAVEKTEMGNSLISGHDGYASLKGSKWTNVASCYAFPWLLQIWSWYSPGHRMKATIAYKQKGWWCLKFPVFFSDRGGKPKVNPPSLP